MEEKNKNKEGKTEREREKGRSDKRKGVSVRETESNKFNDRFLNFLTILIHFNT